MKFFQCLPTFPNSSPSHKVLVILTGYLQDQSNYSLLLVLSSVEDCHAKYTALCQPPLCTNKETHSYVKLDIC